MQTKTGVPPIALSVYGDDLALLPVTSGPTGPESMELLLTIPDVTGTYTIPCIQSSGTLRVSLVFGNVPATSARLKLMCQERVIAEKKASPGQRISFDDLAAGEYTLHVECIDRGGRTLYRTAYGRIGVGVVAAALGDSITEGYYGRGFHQDDLHLTTDKFPSDAASRDGRNFPQFAPTTHDHLPAVNCFESWMTNLNNLLSAAWRVPVFIANEGWGGIASDGYLQMMTKDEGWQARIRLLKPNLWLIHLGVNDERANVSPETFAGNMDSIVSFLVEHCGAKPEQIFIAKPCYDYFEGATAILSKYVEAIDALIQRRGLSRGPDFFAAYATDRQRWYGDDPVHPNVEGMKRMTHLWHDAIVKALPDSVK